MADDWHQGLKEAALNKSVINQLFLLSMFSCCCRYFESLSYGIQSKKSEEKRKAFYYMMMYEDSDAGLLRLFECFMEAAPQLVLQLYILFRNDIPENVDNPFKGYQT